LKNDHIRRIMKAYKPKNIKEHNKELISDYIKNAHLPLTIRQISDGTQLSVVTINKLIVELIESDTIISLDKHAKTGGRFATAYEFNATKELILILQFIENDKNLVVNYHIVDLLGNVIEQKNLKTNNLEELLLNINHFRSVFPQIVLITCGITGVEIDGELRIMDFSPLKNVNLAKEIRDSTQIETIIENDINAATLGYALEENEVLSGVYFPEKFPPGSSLIINQTIFKGSNNISGEIKYLPTFRTAEFPLSQNEIYLKVFDSIQTIIAMYAPHQLIIFIPQVWEKLLNIEKIKDELREIFPKGTLPQMEFSSNFSSLYLAGLIKLSLRN